MLILALNNKRERKWNHIINLVKGKFGEHHLMQERDDDEKFKQYFRSSTSQFNEILLLIGQDIRKQNTNYRKSR